MQGHSLRLKLSAGMRSEDFWPVWDIVCHDQDNPDRTCKIYDRGEWLDGSSCRCGDPACPCRTGDHSECVTFDGEVEEVGPVCRCVVVPGCYIEQCVAEGGFEDCISVRGDLLNVSWSVNIAQEDLGSFVISAPEVHS